MATATVVRARRPRRVVRSRGTILVIRERERPETPEWLSALRWLASAGQVIGAAAAVFGPAVALLSMLIGAAGHSLGWW